MIHREFPGFMSPMLARSAFSFGGAATVAAFASLIACYVGFALETLFNVQAVPFNPHVQAVFMWGLALVATWFVWRDYARHNRALPLALAVAAVVILIVTLYVRYDHRIEALAYVLLVIATLLNQNILLSDLNRTVQSQTAEISALNAQLETRVEQQAGEIGRLERLKEFLAPQIAEAVVADGREDLLRIHRRYIACLFCDIRNFTALSEALEPEDVIDILRRFHDSAGTLVAERGGTIGYRSGDGLMVFFNDPVPCDEPVQQVVSLALDIREAFSEICAPWRRMGHSVGLGVGIDSGHATMGLVGKKGRADYTAIGGVVNIAARLCDAAGEDQILIGQRALMEVEDQVTAQSIGALTLKGLSNPIETYSLTGWRAAG